MPDLRKTRKDLKIALVAMVACDLLAGILYVSPLIGSAETRRMELSQLQADLKQKTLQVAPLKDLPQKVNLASREIGDFYKKRFPAENSETLTEIGKLYVPMQQAMHKVWSRYSDEELKLLLRFATDAYKGVLEATEALNGVLATPPEKRANLKKPKSPR